MMLGFVLAPSLIDKISNLTLFTNLVQNNFVIDFQGEPWNTLGSMCLQPAVCVNMTLIKLLCGLSYLKLYIFCIYVYIKVIAVGKYLSTCGIMQLIYFEMHLETYLSYPCSCSHSARSTPYLSLNTQTCISFV